MMTPEQKIAHFDTLHHIIQVSTLLNKIQQHLLQRMIDHDQSKLKTPEMEVFALFTPKLKHLEYGSPAYFVCLSEMEDCILHHYQNNRHHPEYFKEGIDGMNLIDLIEMICDWKAASLRTKNGNVFDSLQKNRVRFNISDQLFNILQNTLPILEQEGLKHD